MGARGVIKWRIYPLLVGGGGVGPINPNGGCGVGLVK